MVDIRQGRELNPNSEQMAWIEAQNRKIEEAAKNPRKNARIIDKYLEELTDYIQSMSAETFGADWNYYSIAVDKPRGAEILDTLRNSDNATKAAALDYLIDNGYVHSEEIWDSAVANELGDYLGISPEDEEDEDEWDAETHSYVPQDYYNPVGPSETASGSEYVSHDAGFDIDSFMAEGDSEWTTFIGHEQKKARNPNYNPSTSFGGTQGWDYTCTCGMTCEICNKNKGLCGKDGMMYSPSEDVVACSGCRSSSKSAESQVYGRGMIEYSDEEKQAARDAAAKFIEKVNQRDQEILSAYQSGDYSKMDAVVDKYGWDTTTEALKKHKFGRYSDDFRESFAAEYDGPSTLSSALSGARKTDKNGRHLTIMQRLVAKYGIQKGTRIYKHFGVKQKRASPKVRGKVRGTASGPRRYSEGRVGGAGRSQVYQKGDRTGSWTPSGGYTTSYANSGKAWYQERGYGTPVMGPVPDTALAGKAMGEKARGRYVNPAGIVGYPFVPAQQREQKRK